MPDDTRAAVPSTAQNSHADSLAGDRRTDSHADGTVDGPSGTDGAHGSDGVDRFEALEGVEHDEVDEFLRDRVAFTAREWAVARLCADFRTGTGVEMTNVGEHLPELVSFMEEPYTPQAVCSARRSFVEKVREAGATFLYGAYADFLTAEEVDDVLYQATEVAKFLVEVEGATLAVDDELSAEERVRAAMESVHEASLELRYDRCPHCGEELGEDAAAEADGG